MTGLAANFSPIPRIAPPPFGNEIAGAWNGARHSSSRRCVSWSCVKHSLPAQHLVATAHQTEQPRRTHSESPLRTPLTRASIAIPLALCWVSVSSCCQSVLIYLRGSHAQRTGITPKLWLRTNADAQQEPPRFAAHAVSGQRPDARTRPRCQSEAPRWGTLVVASAPDQTGAASCAHRRNCVRRLCVA